MKEDKKKGQVEMPAEMPGGVDAPKIAPTQSYFTKDIEDAMRGMSDVEMFRELLVLEGTRAWIAILKYNQSRLIVSQSAIFAGDPISDPSNMLRHQGIMLGVSDLQNAVIMLKTEKIQQAEEAAENAKTQSSVK